MSIGKIVEASTGERLFTDGGPTALDASQMLERMLNDTIGLK